MTTTNGRIAMTDQRIGELDDDSELAFERGRYRVVAAALIVLAVAGAVGCVVADVF